MRLLGITILSFMILGCSRPLDNKSLVDKLDTLQSDGQEQIDTTKVDINELFQLKSYLDNRIIDSTNLLTIDFDCSLLIYPTDKQIEEMKKEYGEDDFYTIADDANYYQGTAIGLLDSLKINTITSTKPFVRFVGTTNTWTLNLTRKGLPEWNLIFFKTTKEPEIIGTAGLTADEINKYFTLDR
jgi:hypothetical protein